mgnify:FL=1
MNKKKVLKKAFISLFAVLATANLAALEVDRSELQNAPNSSDIVFRNYSGPHTVINSIEQIRGIGSALGNQLKANPDSNGLIGARDRYAVIHAVDPNTKEKFDADIFIIGKGASVDHITNLRRILSAYLSSAYGYSMRDADTIATFVTVYNAVYRGNLDYYKSKYKEIVLDNLTASSVGLSTNYADWPGKTQIVIPLSDFTGLSTIDTSIISDKNVVKSLQGEDDKGIDVRKDMVDLKEREADDMQEKADAAQSEADAEKARLAEEQKKQAEADAAAAKAKADADKAKADADKVKADADKAKADAAKAKADADKAKAGAKDAQKDADAAKKNAKANPDDEQAKKDAEEAQKKADEAQKQAVEAQNQADQAKKDAAAAESDAEKAQNDADKAREDADKAQQDAADQAQKTDEQAKNAEDAQNKADEAQADADKKRDEAQEERTAIAKDQQSLIREASYVSNDEYIMYGLKNVDDEGIMSTIVKMNTSNGSVLKESPVSVIRCRTVYDDGNFFIAVAGSDAENGVVRLVQIDKKNLEITLESSERLSDLSVLVEKDGSYYCTVQDGSDYYIGKFDNNVKNLLTSKVKVKGATPITITSKGIMVTSVSGKAILLRLSDLSSVSKE